MSYAKILYEWWGKGQSLTSVQYGVRRLLYIILSQLSTYVSTPQIYSHSAILITSIIFWDDYSIHIRLAFLYGGTIRDVGQQVNNHAQLQ